MVIFNWHKMYEKFHPLSHCHRSTHMQRFWVKQYKVWSCKRQCRPERVRQTSEKSILKALWKIGVESRFRVWVMSNNWRDTQTKRAPDREKTAYHTVTKRDSGRRRGSQRNQCRVLSSLSNSEPRLTLSNSHRLQRKRNHEISRRSKIPSRTTRKRYRNVGEHHQAS